MDRISDICPPSVRWCIRVRVMRRWTLPVIQMKQEVCSLHMVFMDQQVRISTLELWSTCICIICVMWWYLCIYFEKFLECVTWFFVFMQGSKIEVSLSKAMYRKWAEKFVEGNVYEICFFNVLPVKGCYRATNHPYRILFSKKTSVVQCECDFIPKLGLCLKSSEQVTALNCDPDFLIGNYIFLVFFHFLKSMDLWGGISILICLPNYISLLFHLWCFFLQIWLDY